MPQESNTLIQLAQEIDEQGFVLLSGVFSSAEVDELLATLATATTGLERDGESIRSRSGSVYAARNVLDWYPPARDVWRRAPLAPLLTHVLGPEYGLVRALFFDKPPDRSWSLPWHKDLTIAVADNSRPSTAFRHPTRKAGVPHVEAPEDLLRRMLTLRIHLDDVTDENGPLKVIAGSHRDGKKEHETGQGAAAQSPATHTILTNRGDVLAMRPLLTHASGLSAAETRRHRRILHLEFAAEPNLPDGYHWHTFLSGAK